MLSSDNRAAAPASKQAPFLKLTDAIVRRSGKNILSVGSFVLPEGESIALLGPNGSGKSTFISLMTREVFPLHRDEPPVLFRGCARMTLDEVKQCLGVVSSSMQSQITVHLPAIEVVIGGLFGALGVPKRYSVTDEQRRRAYETMEELHIADLADRDVMTLSTGQARRVLFARSLVHNPDVLVLDEPCTGLDPQGMYYVRHTMRELVQSGRSVILVTHYPEDIIPEIKRLVLIKNGEIFDDGPKDELLTDERMSALFDVPLEVAHSGDYYTLIERY